jgi:Na+-transporting NADH:ubiquinone oxidoreductase subunit C
LVVYVCEVEGAKKYVFPVTGKGLWGGLWGYIALNDDFQTVFGVYMSHESETAGLGSVIAEEKFQKKFDGKSVFAEGDAEHVALTVVKAGKVANDAVEVDGITGATLTCNGVAAMVNGGLQQYVNFFNVNK